MLKTYKTKKDCKFQKTLINLKKIYKSLGININEIQVKNVEKNCTMPFSHHICLETYNDLGANGKGKSLIASLCSAYAELMERLQNGFIIDFTNDEFTYAPDEKIYDLHNISDFSKNYIKNFLISDDDLSQNLLSKIQKLNFLIPQNYLSSHIFDISPEKINNFITVPFYSVFEKKTVELPIGVLRAKNTSNGMCAGNSKEEALVQGISEILERYVTNRVYLNEYSLPLVPAQYWEKYTEIKDLIKYISDVGKYTVKVFDASLEKHFPVIMVMFIDNETNNFSLSFGAHPDFTIALERCLTEFVQGFRFSQPFMKKIFELNLKVDSVEKKEYDNIFIKSVGSIFFDCTHPFFKNLNKNKPDFKLDLGYFDRSLDKSNKEMLNELLCLIKNLDKQIYIRDVSFLGFNSFTVDIPGLSEIRKYNSDEINGIECQIKTSDYFSKKLTSEQITISEMAKAINNLYYKYYDKQVYFIENIPNHFLSFILNLENHDKQKAVESLKVLLLHKQNDKYWDNLFVILYLMLKENSIFNSVEDEYIKELVITAKEIINNPFSTFLNLLNNKFKIRIYNNTDSDEIMQKNKYKDKIRKSLVSKYKKNLPDQNNCSKIFKDMTNI